MPSHHYRSRKYELIGVTGISEKIGHVDEGEFGIVRLVKDPSDVTIPEASFGIIRIILGVSEATIIINNESSTNVLPMMQTMTFTPPLD